MTPTEKEKIFLFLKYFFEYADENSDVVQQAPTFDEGEEEKFKKILKETTLDDDKEEIEETDKIEIEGD